MSPNFKKGDYMDNAEECVDLVNITEAARMAGVSKQAMWSRVQSGWYTVYRNGSRGLFIKTSEVIKDGPKKTPPDGMVSMRDAAQRLDVSYASVLKWKDVMPLYGVEITRSAGMYFIRESDVEKIRANLQPGNQLPLDGPADPEWVGFGELPDLVGRTRPTVWRREKEFRKHGVRIFVRGTRKYVRRSDIETLRREIFDRERRGRPRKDKG